MENGRQANIIRVDYIKFSLIDDAVPTCGRVDPVPVTTPIPSFIPDLPLPRYIISGEGEREAWGRDYPTPSFIFRT